MPVAPRASEGNTGTVPGASAVRDGHFQASLSQRDPAVADLLEAEARRQAGRLELVASENYVSRAQLQASGSAVGNVTVEGYPGARFLGTSPHVDALERLAIERACRVFGAAHANVQPHSGTQANQAVYMALLRPGDTLLSMRLTDGGHFSHGDPATLSGQCYRPVHYGVRTHDGLIDYDEVQALADAHRPALVVAGGSAYPRSIDFERLAQVAASAGARLMVDIAHVAGLVAAGLFPNPVPHADVVTTTTYKNLRGVRGGLILTRDRALGVRIDEALCPGVQGTPVLGLVAGKAVALGEAQTPAFVAYHRQVLANARALAAALTRFGLPVLTGGTDTPFVVLDLRPLGLDGRRAAACLDDCGIGTNAVPVPGDTDFARASGLRLGSSAITTRGMDEADCAEVAELVALALRAAVGQGPGTPERIARRVHALVERFPLYGDDATGGTPHSTP